jgi:hypothetical protein
LVLSSIVFSVVVAEGAVRYIDGYRMFVAPLSESSDSMIVKRDVMDQIPRAAGVERTEPPPRPTRPPTPDEWTRLYRFIEDKPTGGMAFRPSDMFKAWNTVFAGDPCKHKFLHFAPGQLFVYDPSDGMARPPYRFLPDASLPSGLVTNQIGWRGAPVESPRGDRTVRIVFVGSSTVVDAHHLPLSWPELVGHWLNQWAKSKGLTVRFEVLNAGRESIVSSDIAAVVRTEVLPLRPDLVVYYEGGNQFELNSIVEKVPLGSAVRPSYADSAPSWLQTAARYSRPGGARRGEAGCYRQDGSGRPRVAEARLQGGVARGPERTGSRPFLSAPADQSQYHPARPRPDPRRPRNGGQ